MVARVGAVSVSSKAPVRAVTPPTEMPTPIIAVHSGRPAATSDPSVIARTRKPIIMPSFSEPASASSVTRPPPNSTCMPAASAGSALSSSSSRAGSETSSAGIG